MAIITIIRIAIIQIYRIVIITINSMFIISINRSLWPARARIRAATYGCPELL